MRGNRDRKESKKLEEGIIGGHLLSVYIPLQCLPFFFFNNKHAVLYNLKVILKKISKD